MSTCLVDGLGPCTFGNLVRRFNVHGRSVRPAPSLYLNPYSVSINRVMNTCATFSGGKVHARPLFIAHVRSGRNGVVTAFAPGACRIVDGRDSCGVVSVVGTIISRNANHHLHFHCGLGTRVTNGANAAGSGTSN